MTYESSSDLQKRVGRYEVALDELRAAHHDVRNVLHDQVLYDRWQQIGVDLGFIQDIQPLADRGTPVPQLSESWAG
jgi:hypothetical protein